MSIVSEIQELIREVETNKCRFHVYRMNTYECINCGLPWQGGREVKLVDSANERFMMVDGPLIPLGRCKHFASGDEAKCIRYLSDKQHCILCNKDIECEAMGDFCRRFNHRTGAIVSGYPFTERIRS